MSNSNVNFDFDENDNAPIALPRREVQSISVPVAHERKLSFGESTILGGEENTLENIGTYVQEEIQPGVILEGYAVEI